MVNYRITWTPAGGGEPQTSAVSYGGDERRGPQGAAGGRRRHRSPDKLRPDETPLSEQEIAGALALMETMSSEHLEDLELVDRYRNALVEVIDAKAEHRQPKTVGEEAAPAGKVVDLMTALTESAAKAKESRGETAGGDATVHEMTKPKKKTAAKKAPAKKTTARQKDRGEEAHPEARLLNATECTSNLPAGRVLADQSPVDQAWRPASR
ncbi:hypothetical protein [Streptomyces sp. NPDC008121]|uniref:hypothetical protein n=1 Tax=Streptomyces sp. NPDC008121 TaxID=3364809 RepID=UPI0036E36FEC